MHALSNHETPEGYTLGPLRYKVARRFGCEPKLWDQAAAFDDASGWLRLAGADGLSASAAQ